MFLKLRHEKWHKRKLKNVPRKNSYKAWNLETGEDTF